jgi:hypothetical protein
MQPCMGPLIGNERAVQRFWRVQWQIIIFEIKKFELFSFKLKIKYYQIENKIFP